MLIRGVRKGTIMKTRNGCHQEGFTLVEIMITVAIIGLLTALAFPAFQNARLRSQYAKIGADFRVFGTAFNQYAMDTGDYPPDSHIILPAGMDEYIREGAWLKSNPMGGTYNWDGPNGYPYAGIAIFESNASVQEFEALDAMIDDGDTATGEFRLMANGRYTYLVE